MPEFAVLGSPIAHSLSPVLHAAAYAECGLDDFVYGRHEVAAGELEQFLAAHPAHTGFSLTMPLKAELLSLAQRNCWDIAPAVEQTGAANTLVRMPDGSARILNTDVTGIVRALSEAGPLPSAPSAAVLGNGATASSAVAALVELGAQSIDFHVRSPERAVAVRAQAEAAGVRTAVLLLDDWTPGERDITVSTLPAGALGEAALRWPTRISAQAVLLDVAYPAPEDGVLAGFAARGGRVAAGERMLIHQAVEQVIEFAAAGAHSMSLLSERERIAAAMTAALEA